MRGGGDSRLGTLIGRPYQLARRHFRPCKPTGPLLFDSFDRPDGAPGSAETGQLYTVVGNMQISGGACGNLSNNARIVALIGVADLYYLEAKLAAYGVYPQMELLRTDAANTFLLEFDRGNNIIRSYDVVAGVKTQTSNTPSGGGIAFDAGFRLEVQLPLVRIYTNGVLRASVPTAVAGGVSVAIGGSFSNGQKWDFWTADRL